MDIAIQSQMINLENDKMFFKNIGLIKGMYNKERNIFTDEYGKKYYSIEGENPYAENYFCYPNTIDNLKQNYQESTPDNEILTEYLNELMNICFIGYIDTVFGSIKLMEFSLDEIQSVILRNEYGLNEVEDEETVQIDYSENQRFIFDIKSLIALKNYNSIEEIRNYIDTLMSVGDYICEQQNINMESNQDSELLQNDKTKKEKLQLKKEESNKFNLKEMREYVFSEIIAQDEAVKRITTCIMSNFDTTNPKRKSHLLLTGPTGTGKSKTIQLVCEYLGIPFAKVDATDYTQSGYVGRSVSEMIEKLIYIANGDIELAQKGILVIDEIDKKAAKGENSTIATKAVLDSLLKITGRGIIEVDIVENDQKKTIDFDTSNLTVIFTGAFEGIEKMNTNIDHKSVGFIIPEQTKKQPNQDIHKLLIKYGMTPELIGRIKCIVPLKSYDEKDYVQILKLSKGSPLLIEKEHYENEKGIKFTYTSDFVKELAKQAKSLDIGARGLETVTAKALENIQERILNGENIKVLKLTKRTALNNKEYYCEK